MTIEFEASLQIFQNPGPVDNIRLSGCSATGMASAGPQSQYVTSGNLRPDDIRPMLGHPRDFKTPPFQSTSGCRHQIEPQVEDPPPPYPGVDRKLSQTISPGVTDIWRGSHRSNREKSRMGWLYVAIDRVCGRVNMFENTEDILVHKKVHFEPYFWTLRLMNLSFFAKSFPVLQRVCSVKKIGTDGVQCIGAVKMESQNWTALLLLVFY